jgi:hypothetical protein
MVGPHLLPCAGQRTRISSECYELPTPPRVPAFDQAVDVHGASCMIWLALMWERRILLKPLLAVGAHTVCPGECVCGILIPDGFTENLAAPCTSETERLRVVY